MYQIRRGKRGWWILGFECGAMGPYKTRAEALEDARGVQRFYRNWKKEKLEDQK